MKHVHLIGVGGSGLSAIALILLERGYKVSGSDRQISPPAQRLQTAGARIFIGHDAANIAGADLVIRSSAIPDDNVEVRAAQNAGVPVLKRAEFLNQLTEGHQVIAVAGTHGKTTTTAMLAWIMVSYGLDPSFIVGSSSSNLGTNAHSGKGVYFVIEADEYDRMFLGLQPDIAIVTTVEHDHPDCFPTQKDFEQAFVEFVRGIKLGGKLVLCGEDPGAARLMKGAISRGIQCIVYGVSSNGHEITSSISGLGYDYFACNITRNRRGCFTFDAQDREGTISVEVALQVPGLHNVSNSLAAFAVADRLGLDMERVAKALSDYRGTERRFDIKDEVAGILIIDDYAHHPTEIKSTLAAARSRFPGRPLWIVWQPHTYSRTRTFIEDFVAAFDEADHVVVTEIYPARESPPEDGFSSKKVVEMMLTRKTPNRYDIRFIPTLSMARDLLLEELNSGDILLVLSAGDADQMSAELFKLLKNRMPMSSTGRP